MNNQRSWSGFITILLFGLVLVACGGPVNTNATLRLLVSGLPSGTPAAIRIVLPDKSERTASTSGDLVLPAGTYQVTGAAVSNPTPGANAFASSVSNQEVVLTAGKISEVAIGYQELVTKISPKVKVADAATLAALNSITLETNGNSTLEFSTNTTQMAGLVMDDLLVLGVSANSPFGHYGKVVSVIGNTVVTTPVELSEAIEEGAVVTTQKLDANAPGVGLPKGFSRGIKPGCLKVNLPISVGGGVNQHVDVDGTITVAGELCMELDFDVRFSLSRKIVPNFYFTVRNQISSKFDISGTVTATLSKEIEVVSLNFTPITVFIGPVPVVLVPKIALYIGASGSVTAGVRFGVEAGADMLGGFNYNANKNKFTPISRTSTSFTPPYPEPTASMSIKVYLAPEASLMLYGVVGPYARVTPFVRFDVNFLPAVNWKLFAGITFSAGVRAGFVIFRIQANFDLYTFEKEILSSTTPPPIGAPVGSVAGFKTQNGMATNSSTRIFVASGANVKAFDGTTQVWNFPTAEVVLGVLSGADGSIYAWDFLGNIYAINPEGTQRWKSAEHGALGIRQVALSGATLVASGGNGVRSFNAQSGVAGWTAFPIPNDSLYGVGIAKDGSVWANGAEKVYKFSANGDFISSLAAPSSPGNLAIDNSGNVYVRTSEFVYGINPNVTFKWTSNNNRVAFPDGGSDQASSPAVGADGTIYVCTTPPNAGLNAINPNGTVKWKFRFRSICKTTPTLGSNGKIYIQTNSEVAAVNADGTLAWTQPILANNPPSMLFDNNKRLVVGSLNGLARFAADTTLANSWAREGSDSFGSGVGR
jgi:hypothetical protein